MAQHFAKMELIKDIPLPVLRDILNEYADRQRNSENGENNGRSGHS